MGALDNANSFLAFLIERREVFQGSRQGFQRLQADDYCSQGDQVRLLLATSVKASDSTGARAVFR
jgi:hypothetical protein